MSHFAYGFCFLSVWQLENVNKTFEMGPGVRLEIHMQRRRGRNETISCKNCSPRSNGDKTAGVEKETQAELNQNFSCWENIWLIFDLIMRMVFFQNLLKVNKTVTAKADSTNIQEFDSPRGSDASPVTTDPRTGMPFKKHHHSVKKFQTPSVSRRNARERNRVKQVNLKKPCWTCM